MAGTRSSARHAAAGNNNNTNDASSPPSSAKSTGGGGGGTKRKADASNGSPAATATKAKRGRPAKAAKKMEQKTLEETMPDAGAEDEDEDEDMKEGNGAGAEAENGDGEGEAGGKGDANDAANGEGKKDDNGEKYIKEPGESFKGKTKDGETKEDPEKALKDTRGHGGLNALDQVQAAEDDAGTTTKKENGADEKDAVAGGEANGEAIESDEKRGNAQPSNVLEKGIIYFFTRGRVGVEDPDSVQDIARSYFVLRPLPADGKITDGAIQDVDKNRLIALPKKVWPKSGKDRFMAFVEKAGVTMASLKEDFFQGSEYSTKTTGTRQTPPVTPIGEGVYAITSTGGGQGTTHLAYILTIPAEVSEVQKDMGLAERGSLVLSLKNPESSSPANAQLPQNPDYPKDFIDEFRGRGWMPVAPKHLDYAHAQMLLIGENFESSNNLEPAAKDERDGSKETPQEELEKLEHEDDLRVEHLKGDDTIFADLGLSSKEYPKVMTTW